MAIQPSQNGLFHADRRPKSPKIKHFLHLQQLIKGNKMNIFIDKLKQLLAIAKLKKNINSLYEFYMKYRSTIFKKLGLTVSNLGLHEITN